MRVRARFHGCFLLATAALAIPCSSIAAITATPSTVSAFPSQTTTPITLDLTFPVTGAAGTGTIVDTGTPAGTTTVPAPITYPFAARATTAQTTFQFAVGAGTLPGTYSVDLRDATNGAGLATVTLVVNNPAITPAASPNPVTLTIGGSAQPVTVSTTTDPGFNARTITYTFTGLPAFINFGGPQSVSSPYPPLTFPFSLTAGAAAGTYPGTLTGSYTDATGTPQSRSIPFTVIVQQPDIAARFSNPSPAVCEGGPAVSDTIELSPVNNYNGTPRLTFSAPAGISITPSSPVSGAMPPPQSIPFTVQASGASGGPQIVTLDITDPAANINKSITLTVNVSLPDFTPAVTPNFVSLTAGGGGQTITASMTANGCFSAPTVAVSASGQPAGVTFNPAPATISGPAYGPVSIVVQADASVAPATYNVTLTFTPSTGAAKTVPFQITVAAQPDFRLDVNPASISVVAGATTNLIVSATGINGFTGDVTVNAPTHADLVFSPSTFIVPAGGSQLVTITAAIGATATTIPTAFTGSAPTVGTRSAAVTITITPGPDFRLDVTPPSVTVAQGQTTTVNVTATGINGFASPVTVTTPASADVTFTPATFTIVPGVPQQVTIAARLTASAGTFNGVFTGTGAGVIGARTAPLSVTITLAPDFVLSVMPSSVTVPQGGTTTVAVVANALNGLTGPVTVTATSGGLTVSPATFTLTPGVAQNVTITVPPTAPTGPASVTFSGTNALVSGPRNATLAVDVSARPDFSLTVTPPALDIPAGESALAVVSLAGLNGFTGQVAIVATVPAGLVVTPSSFTLTPGATQSVRIDTVAGVAPGEPHPVTVRFIGTAPGLSHIADLLVLQLPSRPVITTIVPPGVATGIRSLVLRLSGHFFQPGARVVAASPGVTVESVAILSPELADVTISVRADASPGQTLLTLTNPDGLSAASPLLIYPAGSIAAPLSVTTAAIVFPPQGTMIAGNDGVYPRGLLATAGTGTIIGTWNFDGVPFDRFTVTVGGGYPAEIRAHVPIPISFAGGHTLELAIESPQYAVSPAVEVIMAAANVARLAIFAPRDGAVIAGAAPLFRWSLVPNAGGYLVEINDVQIRLSDPEWQPAAEVLRRLGAGIHRWRVRAVFPGETEGEPTAWQRVAILPQHVELLVGRPTLDPRLGRLVVRWTGGVAGLLYRVEVLGSDGRTVFSALTARSEYVLPATMTTLPPGFAVRVTALVPGGASVGTSASVALTSRMMRRDRPFILVQAQPAVTSQQPPSGATITTHQPRIEARWSGNVRPDEVSLMIDQTDVTAVASISSGSLTYDSLLPLDSGPHTVRLGLGDAVTTWTFTVTEAPAAPTPAPTAEKPAETPEEKKEKAARGTLRTDWAISPVGTLTWIDGSGPNKNDDVRLQLSTQTDLSNDFTAVKATGNVSLKHALDDPNKTIQESRNWLTQFNAHQGSFKEEARIGYAAPGFVDQSELMSTGLARGGMEGRLYLPFAIASYYQTFGTRPTGVVAGNFGPTQTIRAAALQAPVNPKWDLRFIGLRVTDDPGFNSAGGTGEAYGLFGKYILNPKLTLLGELARGSFEPNPGSAEGTREGSALRIGASGSLGTLTYAVNARRTDSDFVNPANRGFTPGGIPDRTGLNVSLTKLIGRTSVGLQLRQLKDGNSSTAILPKNRENGAVLSINTVLASRVSLALAGNWTADRGNANTTLFLPKLDRRQSGASGTLSETVGRFSLSQSVSFQQFTDEINALSNQKTTTATLSAAGALARNFNLAAILSGTRMEGSTAVGATDQIMASLQPSYTIQALSITLQPRAMYSRTKNDLTNQESRSEQYAALLSWAPPWLRSGLSFQLSADGNRNRSSYQIVPARFARRYAGTLSLKWGAGSAPATPTTTVFNPPADAATTAPKDPSTTSSISQ